MQSRKIPIDYTIVTLVLCFFVISLVAIYSVSGQYMGGDSTYFVKRQLVFYIVGFIVMVVIASIDFEMLEKWTIPLYIFGMLLLIAVEFVGVERYGAKRWLDLPGIRIQQSEFMKFFLILHITVLLAGIGKKRLRFRMMIDCNFNNFTYI